MIRPHSASRAPAASLLARALGTAFRAHPDAATYRIQPSLGPVLATRVLAEFCDDRQRYSRAKARNNYAATSPITGQSRKK